MYAETFGKNISTATLAIGLLASASTFAQTGGEPGKFVIDRNSVAVTDASTLTGIPTTLYCNDGYILKRFTEENSLIAGPYTYRPKLFQSEDQSTIMIQATDSPKLTISYEFAMSNLREYMLDQTVSAYGNKVLTYQDDRGTHYALIKVTCGK